MPFALTVDANNDLCAQGIKRKETFLTLFLAKERGIANTSILGVYTLHA